MLSDPIAITFDSAAKSLPRASAVVPNHKKELGSSTYRTADGEFVAKTTRTQLADNSVKTEFLLGRIVVASGDANYVGISFIQKDLDNSSLADFDKLRTALLTFVSSTVQGRLIAGEL